MHEPPPAPSVLTAEQKAIIDANRRRALARKVARRADMLASLHTTTSIIHDHDAEPEVWAPPVPAVKIACTARLREKFNFNSRAVGAHIRGGA